MNRYAKLWSIGAVGCVAALLLATPVLHRTLALTAFSDIVQSILLLFGAVVFIPRSVHSHGRLRLFWSLIALGLAFWLCYQLLWTYIEVVLRQSVPDLFWGDIVLFLHLVPLIAAVALRPHIQPDDYSARVGRLDFGLLAVWWIYLYVFLVMSWQYAVPNNAAYNRNLNAVYLIEKIALLTALAACSWSGKGAWRAFYANLFGATLLYAASSYVANWAIANASYYSGSWYDIPLVASMAWFVLMGLWSKADAPAVGVRRVFSAYGVWVARGGMIAAFSLPLFAAWAISDVAVPHEVRSYRLIATLATALVMGIMVFVRQNMLDRELTRLLYQSQESVNNLHHLQQQVLDQEKLASIGQLVGGAAHELNNPITAMLGYSDLLLSTRLAPRQQELAAKIGHNVRRTKSLVAGLLTLAKRAPFSRTAVDLNMMLRTAAKLSESQWQALKFELRLELDPALPRIPGDSNQLLQLCVQLLGNALHALTETGQPSVTVRTSTQDGLCVLQLFPQGLGVATDDSSRITAVSPETLGLTACLGIVQDHHGHIWCERVADSGTTVRVELPLAAPEGSGATAPAAALLSSQSSS